MIECIPVAILANRLLASEMYNSFDDIDVHSVYFIVVCPSSTKENHLAPQARYPR